MMKINRIDFVLNVFIVLSTLWAVVMYFIGGPDILGSQNAECFKYFTTDSNILAALGSLLYLIYYIKNIKNTIKPIPKWITIFKFVGTCAATVTLLTVLFFLIPIAIIKGKGFTCVPLFFTGNVFVLHLSTPVLSIISTLFLEKKRTITKKQALFGTIPTLIYSLVYLTMVVILKQWNDWYGFTFGGKYQYVPFVIIIMFLFSLVITLMEYKIKNSNATKKES